MGSRMSVTPSWAMIGPIGQLDQRMASVRLGMDDVDAAGGVLNSQCASITPRPLFMSVAESMVIFRPIRRVGCG